MEELEPSCSKSYGSMRILLCAIGALSYSCCIFTPNVKAFSPLQPPAGVGEHTFSVSDPQFAGHFLDSVNTQLDGWKHRMALARFSHNTNLTEANSRKITQIAIKFHAWSKQKQAEARRFNLSYLPESLSRQLRLFIPSSTAKDPAVQREVSELGSHLSQLYGRGRVCLSTGQCMDLEPELVDVMSKSRDPQLLSEAWTKWRDATGPLMKPFYIRFVKAVNIGAVDNGFSDYSEVMKNNSFFETPELEEMIERLWEDIRPMYQQLHAYVRRKLREKYGPEVVGTDGAIPAHLLGNMWAQHWTDVMDIVTNNPSLDEQQEAQTHLEENLDVNGMVRLAESFYTDIGLFPMTSTFWEESMLVKPEGREVVCHASAFDMYYPGDFRISMCGEVNLNNLFTVHHEMGHIEYYMAYANQPSIFRSGANAAFHESVGDTIGLSVMSQTHLRRLGLVSGKSEGVANDEDEELTVHRLLPMALEKLAFLPFGLLIDQWRWQVMQGRIQPDNYNRRWWELRLQYQGIRSPVARTESDFDPGAKYHIPSNTGYIRYFFSHFLQFQFYKTLCQESGHTGPLHLCDFGGSKAAGQKLKRMLQQGISRPWQDQLTEMTGEDTVTSTAFWDYFRPLYDWLVRDNAQHGERIGWEGARINFAEV